MGRLPQANPRRHHLPGERGIVPAQRAHALLEARLADATQQLAATQTGSSEHKSIQRKVKEMKAQVNALLQEEAISQFVEDSVIATVSRPHPLEIQDGFDE